MPPIRTMIVGAGRIGAAYERNPEAEHPCTHAGAFCGHPGFDVVAIVDSDRTRGAEAAAKFGIPNHAEDLATAMAQWRPDMVTVAVPSPFHRATVSTAIAAYPPRVVFCEKPIAENLDDAEAMVRTCAARGVGLFVNNRRLADTYRYVAEVLAEEFAGDVLTFNAWCSSGLRAVGVHMIDLIQDLFGTVAEVRAVPEPGRVESLPHSENYRPDDPRVRALLNLESGLTGGFSNTAHSDYIYFEIEILCRTGKIRVSDNGAEVRVWKTLPPGDYAISYRLAKPEVRSWPRKALFAAIADSLAGSPKTNAVHPLAASHAVSALRVIEALKRSAETDGIPIRPDSLQPRTKVQT